MGGFTGGDPAMTPERLEDLTATGKLRFVLAGDGGPRGGSSEVTSWVQANCTAVDGLHDCG